MTILNNNLESYKVDIKVTDYITVFLLIYLSSSFFALSIPGYINIALFLATALITFMFSEKKQRIRVDVLFFVLLIVISSALTMLLNSDGIYNYLIFWAYLFSAYLIYISIDIRVFILIFSRIMYFLCVFSLITFVLLMIYPAVFNIFPLITNNAGLTMSNVVFSVVKNSNYFNSNSGLFWEPGAYQTFINLALFIQIFVLKELNQKKIMIFLVTIFTTFSTTGYISAIIILVSFILNKRSVKNKIKNRRKLIVTLFFCLAFGIIMFNSLPDIITFKVFGKLEALYNPELVEVNPSYSSTTARTDSIMVPVLSLLYNPIFGVGFSNLFLNAKELGSGYLTATPLNWLGLFGIPIGVIINLCVWRWTKLIEGGIFLRILLFLFLLVIVLSENYNRNAFYIAFLLYSFDYKYLKSNYKVLVKKK